MFLTDNHRSVPVPQYHSVPAQNPKHLSSQFNTSLSSRLLSLLSPTVDLSWLSRATAVLSSTLNDATSLLLLHPSSLPPSLFDSTSLDLLDACNSISIVTDRILNRLMFLRFSLRTHKHAVTNVLPLPEINMIHHFHLSSKALHGEMTPVLNAVYAVEAVSALIICAVSVVLTGKGKEYLHGLKVHSEVFAWGSEFNKVVESVYSKTGDSCVQMKLERMEKTVLNEELERKGMEEMERMSEEMREGLERFKGGINAVFRAALCSRNASVQNLRVGPKKM